MMALAILPPPMKAMVTGESALGAVVMSCEGLKEDISAGKNEMSIQLSAIVAFQQPRQTRKLRKKPSADKEKT
jgi:hypothetical protein